MRCVAVKKETLAKEGEIPMEQKEDNYDHLDLLKLGGQIYDEDENK